MSLKIRMARAGAKKRPFYHIVIAESRSPRDGRFIERIGSYNPMLPRGDANRVVLKEDRAKHWLSNGATPSERVAYFLAEKGLGEKPKQRVQTTKQLPKAKAQERMKATEEAKVAAAAAKKAEQEAAAAAAAAPAEETPAEELADAPAEATSGTPAETPAETAAETAADDSTGAAEEPVAG
jgi:small subunit ribosomal protein S16